MSTLRPDAPREEIQDELDFLQISLTTIDPDADDALQTRNAIDIQMQDLWQRLERLENPRGEAIARPRTPEITLNGSFHDIDLPSRESRRQPGINGGSGSSLARPASPLSRPASSNKRPRDSSWSFAALGDDDPRKFRRTSDTSDVTSTEDLDQVDRAFDGGRGAGFSRDREGIMQKLLERQQQAEERVKREKEDAEFARMLSQGHGGPSSAPVFGRPDPPRMQSFLTANGQMHKPARSPSPPAFQPPYRAPIASATPSSSRAVQPVPQGHKPVKYESDSDLEEITPVQFRVAADSSPARVKREQARSTQEAAIRAEHMRDNAAARINARNAAQAQVLAASANKAARAGFNPMQGGTSVYGTGAGTGAYGVNNGAYNVNNGAYTVNNGAYTTNNLPSYGNGIRPIPTPQARMPGAFPGTDMDELLNLVGTQRGGRDMTPMEISDDEQYDPYSRNPYGNPYATGYNPSAYVPGGMTEEEIEEMMKAVQADKHFPIEKRAQTPRDLSVPLYEHQRIGLTWLMLQEENKACKGGILADDMGLGKTIQALALILARPSDEPGRKTTLIVAPVALMKQWEREIDAKVRRGHKLKVFVHHGQKKKKTFAELSAYDVVLTTYGTLGSEHNTLTKMNERLVADPGSRPRRDEKLCLIGKDAKWYRVILDEAQLIKNKLTKAAQGAHALNALYRLCMSGTPMMNNIGELHALIYFLRIPPYNDATKFTRDIKRPLSSHQDYSKNRAMQAVQALLKGIMLRRTKKSEVDGKPIIANLPERTSETVHAVFDEQQEQFYRAIETETQLQVNRYLEAGKIGKNYSYILVRLLRLRQACCHPHLIRDFGESSATNDVSTEVMEDLAKQFEEKVVIRLKEAEGAFECPICYDATEQPTIIFPCGHDVCGDCFTRLIDPSNGLANGMEGGSGARCPECRGQLDGKKVVSWQAFKKVHMPDSLPEEERAAIQEEEDSDSDSDDDSDDEEDADENGDLRDFIVDDDEEELEDDEEVSRVKDEEETASEAEETPSTRRRSHAASRVVKDEDETASEADGQDNVDDDDDFAPVRDAGSSAAAASASASSSNPVKKSSKGKAVAKAKAKGKGKAKDKSKRKGKGKKKEKKTLADLKREGMRNAAAKKKYIKRLRKTWVPSAKTNRTVELLREIREKGEGEKTIIFSQFTTLLDLLEVAIGDEFKYRRYDGGMQPKERDAAVEAFQTPGSDIEVLLVSLKAGNAGLNLTAANRVIILDPFWNPFVEEQAIDRAHRIGQTRPVQVHRILVQTTVEDRIIELQEKKRLLITTALDEKAAQETLGRLGVQELRYLFGFSSHLPGGPAAAAANPANPGPA